MKDEVLACVVRQFGEHVVSIEDQGSLLEDIPDLHLNEQQELEAELEYEQVENELLITPQYSYTSPVTNRQY